MADWKIEDRQNDWLAQEMAREGYVNNKSLLEEDHQKHENSRNWDAGAISNAKQHEEIHNRIKNQTIKQEPKSFKPLILGMIVPFLFLSLLSSLRDELPYHLRYNEIFMVVYYLANIIFFIMFISNLISLMGLLKNKGGQ